MRLKKRGMSILLTLAMLFSMLPSVALAIESYTVDFFVSDVNGAVAGA